MVEVGGKLPRFLDALLGHRPLPDARGGGILGGRSAGVHRGRMSNGTIPRLMFSIWELRSRIGPPLIKNAV